MMPITREQDVTSAVLRVMEQTNNPRLREIMVSLVTHLHGFIRDVRLTEAECREAAALIAGLGKRTTDTHNEVILMAGSLGVSSLVCLQNNGFGGEDTTANLMGPFWRQGSPEEKDGASIVRSPTPGTPIFVTGTVVDQNGAPVDVFFSADNEYPKKLEESGFAEPRSTQIYGIGRIVLWMPASAKCNPERGGWQWLRCS